MASHRRSRWCYCDYRSCADKSERAGRLLRVEGVGRGGWRKTFFPPLRFSSVLTLTNYDCSTAKHGRNFCIKNLGNFFFYFLFTFLAGFFFLSLQLSSFPIELLFIRRRRSRLIVFVDNIFELLSASQTESTNFSSSTHMYCDKFQW